MSNLGFGPVASGADTGVVSGVVAELSALGTAETSGKIGQLSEPLLLLARGTARLSGRPAMAAQAELSAKGTARTRALVTGPLVNTISLSASGAARTSGQTQFQRHAHLNARTSFQIKGRAAAPDNNLETPISGSPIPRTLADPDPLWVAVEIDLWDTFQAQNSDNTTTLRLGNRGALTRTVGGTLYQYMPRLKTPILLGTSLTVFSGGGDNSFSMFQTPLRGQPNGGRIEWAVDAELMQTFPSQIGNANFPWLDTIRFRWIGRTFRVYEGRTRSDITADVDADLTLVYTGHVTNFTVDLTASGGQTAGIDTTDALSALDRTVVDDLYPADFPIVNLQGKPLPELRGRAFSIQPVLEDSANLIYRVTHIIPGLVELDDITEVRVGTVPWTRVSGGARVQSYLIIRGGPGPAYLMFYATPADVAYWQNIGDTVTLGSALPPLRPGDVLYNIVQTEVGGGPSYIAALSPADVGWWVNVAGATVTPYAGVPPAPSPLGPPAPPPQFGPQQGEWAADLASGTIQLGSVTGGAEVRCDAQTIGWETFDLAQLMIDLCTQKGVPIDPASMAQLRIDAPWRVGHWTDTNPINCLDYLDAATLASLCWWTCGADAAVIAGLVKGPEQDFISDYMLLGSAPQAPLDRNLLAPAGMEPLDPVPKEIAAITQTQVLPPAWRAILGWAKRWSPATASLGGVTDAEAAFWAAPELTQDWSSAFASGWSLDPNQGLVILRSDPRAQDIYVSTLAWRQEDVGQMRQHLVQNITGNLDRSIYNALAWMPTSSQIRLFQRVTLLWVDVTARYQIVYAGIFRVTSAIRSIGGGPQQLELWGSVNMTQALRSSATSAPPVITNVMLQVPTGISFSVFSVNLI